MGRASKKLKKSDGKQAGSKPALEGKSKPEKTSRLWFDFDLGAPDEILTDLLGGMGPESEDKARELAEKLVMLEKVRGAIRSLDMANAWVKSAEGATSRYMERVELQVGLAKSYLARPGARTSKSSAVINAGGFETSGKCWRDVADAVVARDIELDRCRDLIQTVIGMTGPEVGWCQIIKYVTVDGLLIDPVLMAKQIRGNDLWGYKFAEDKGWVPLPKPKYEAPPFPDSPGESRFSVAG